MAFIDYNAKPDLKIWDGIHGKIHHSDQYTFCHVTLEQGAALPEHHHKHEQWTHVLEGQLQFTLAGKTVTMGPGMSVHILSDLPHSAIALTRCKVMDAFMPVREDFKSLEPWVPG